MPAEAQAEAVPVREARPREPKTATVERREASVPRHGTQGASQAPGTLRHKRVHARLRRNTACPTGVSQTPERLSALRPPLDRGERSKKQNLGAKSGRGSEEVCGVRCGGEEESGKEQENTGNGAARMGRATVVCEGQREA